MLETSNLLTVNRDGAGALISLDAHPHLRGYFAKQFCEKNPEAWRAGHKLLYEHLCTTTPDKPEATLEDLEPLYQAVAHGCQAGLQLEACVKVYRARILRDSGKIEFYSTKKLARSVLIWEPSPAFSTNHGIKFRPRLQKLSKPGCIAKPLSD